MNNCIRTLSFGENSQTEYELYSNIASEGTSYDLKITSPGWKRILSTIRSNAGHVDISIACNSSEKPKVYQNVGLQYSGYVNYPHEAWTGNDNAPNSNAIPYIYQTYNNIFGEDTKVNPENSLKITAARLGYAKPGTIINDESEFPRNNSIKCYLDVYVDFSSDIFSEVELKVNYAGKIYNHGIKLIKNKEDLEASDEGIYGEELEYFYIQLNPNYALSNIYQNYLSSLESNEILTNSLTITNYPSDNIDEINFGKSSIQETIDCLEFNEPQENPLIKVVNTFTNDSIIFNYANQGKTLSKIDFKTKKFYDEEAKEIYTFDNSIFSYLSKNVSYKFYLLNNDGQQEIAPTYSYNLKIDLLDMLQRISTLEKNPTIYSGSAAELDNAIGKPGDIWVITEGSTAE